MISASLSLRNPASWWKPERFPWIASLEKEKDAVGVSKDDDIEVVDAGVSDSDDIEAILDDIDLD